MIEAQHRKRKFLRSTFDSLSFVIVDGTSRYSMSGTNVISTDAGWTKTLPRHGTFPVEVIKYSVIHMLYKRILLCPLMEAW